MEDDGQGSVIQILVTVYIIDTGNLMDGMLISVHVLWRSYK